MGINGINPYAEPMQNYRMASITTVNAEEVPVSGKNLPENVSGSVTAVSENTRVTPSVEAVEKPERKDVPLEDISITFNRQEDFGYIGKDSDVRSLDMEKAISDMKKDSVLQQYQYFVGSSRNLCGESPDGKVIQKF